MSDQCRGEVAYGSWGRTRRCTRAAWKDGFCKQHHPESERARREVSIEREKKALYNSPYGRLERAAKRIAELEAERDRLKAINAELLSVCKDLASRFNREIQELTDNHNCGREYKEWELARAAIAKAEAAQ